MSKIKNQNEIEILREGGRRLGAVLSEMTKNAKAGVTTAFLNKMAEDMIRGMGDEPAFLHYTPYGAERPYPATLCVSINDEIVHGIPNENVKILKDGDIVGLDLGLKHRGLFVDSAVTVGVGCVDEKSKRLMEVTDKALYVGISVCVAGNHINDIGCAIEKFVKPFKFGLVEELGGHGVGHRVHEEPYIHNFCRKGKSDIIKPGMVLALEPMLNEGTKHIVLDDDGYTFKTADGKKSAHFEHTILVTEGEPEVLTKRD